MSNTKPIVVPFYEPKPHLAEVYKVRKFRRVITVKDISDANYSYIEQISIGETDKATGHIWHAPYLEIRRYPNISQQTLNLVLNILDNNQNTS